jgi:hypothetical protein
MGTAGRGFRRSRASLTLVVVNGKRGVVTFYASRTAPMSCSPSCDPELAVDVDYRGHGRWRCQLEHVVIEACDAIRSRGWLDIRAWGVHGGRPRSLERWCIHRVGLGSGRWGMGERSRAWWTASFAFLKHSGSPSTGGSSSITPLSLANPPTCDLCGWSSVEDGCQVPSLIASGNWPKSQCLYEISMEQQQQRQRKTS